MKFLLAICASLLDGFVGLRSFAATANGSFNFDFASDPACSATVTADCIDHFEVWDVTVRPRNWLLCAA